MFWKASFLSSTSSWSPPTAKDCHAMHTIAIHPHSICILLVRCAFHSDSLLPRIGFSVCYNHNFYWYSQPLFTLHKPIICCVRKSGLVSNLLHWVAFGVCSGCIITGNKNLRIFRRVWKVFFDDRGHLLRQLLLNLDHDLKWSREKPRSHEIVNLYCKWWSWQTWKLQYLSKKKKKSCIRHCRLVTVNAKSSDITQT